LRNKYARPYSLGKLSKFSKAGIDSPIRKRRIFNQNFGFSSPAFRLSQSHLFRLLENGQSDLSSDFYHRHLISIRWLVVSISQWNSQTHFFLLFPLKNIGLSQSVKG
jgi:hypothetical protein